MVGHPGGGRRPRGESEDGGLSTLCLASPLISVTLSKTPAWQSSYFFKKQKPGLHPQTQRGFHIEGSPSPSTMQRAETPRFEFGSRFDREAHRRADQRRAPSEAFLPSPPTAYKSPERSGGSTAALPASSTAPARPGPVRPVWPSDSEKARPQLGHLSGLWARSAGRRAGGAACLGTSCDVGENRT